MVEERQPDGLSWLVIRPRSRSCFGSDHLSIPPATSFFLPGVADGFALILCVRSKTLPPLPSW